MSALRDAPAAFGTTYEEAGAWSSAGWSTLFSGLRAFVAVDDDRDVGVVRTAPELEVRGAPRLGSLWVAPEVRGTGVGSALIETVVAWARTEGFEEILLDVSDDNPEAVRLHLREPSS